MSTRDVQAKRMRAGKSVPWGEKEKVSDYEGQ